MDKNNAADEQDTELSWEMQPWADDVRELIRCKGKSDPGIVELLEKIDLRFFDWDLIQDGESTVDWVKAFREVSYNKRLGAYWAGKA
jgi:hypothetical protein